MGTERDSVNRDEREAQWTAWMRAAVLGDEVAYRALLQALAMWLRTVMRNRLAGAGAEGDVEDAVQETLLAIHLKRHTWRREELVGPWVAAIARNKLVDQIRRRGRRAELPLDDLLADTLEARTDEEPSTSHDLASAMADLNERQRAIVHLVAIEGHSSRDAAQRLGITEGALRVALHRTLRAMAQRLERQVKR